MTQVTGKGIGVVSQRRETHRICTTGKCRFIAVVMTGLLQQVMKIGMTELGQLAGNNAGYCSGHRDLFVDYYFAQRNTIPKDAILSSTAVQSLVQIKTNT